MWLREERPWPAFLLHTIKLHQVQTAWQVRRRGSASRGAARMTGPARWAQNQEVNVWVGSVLLGGTLGLLLCNYSDKGSVTVHQAYPQV